HSIFKITNETAFVNDTFVGNNWVIFKEEVPKEIASGESYPEASMKRVKYRAVFFCRTVRRWFCRFVSKRIFCGKKLLLRQIQSNKKRSNVMKKHLLLFIAIIAMIMVLSACGSTTTDTPVSTTDTTVTVAPTIAPTATDTATPTPMVTVAP
ncbi:MAG: hypothetical protein JWM44_2774, partial [Bacilli bacterium]|nr:hypothetical protein [Bacilli bacterium]